jgi:hypothetical protein
MSLSDGPRFRPHLGCLGIGLRMLFVLDCLLSCSMFTGQLWSSRITYTRTNRTSTVEMFPLIFLIREDCQPCLRPHHATAPDPAERYARSIPLNATPNGRILSWKCSIFAPGQSEQSRLAARIDGIDRAFLFGKTRLPERASSITTQKIIDGSARLQIGSAQFAAALT